MKNSLSLAGLLTENVTRKPLAYQKNLSYNSGVGLYQPVLIDTAKKSIYGENFKAVVAEAPATTQVALLILLNVVATSVH